MKRWSKLLIVVALIGAVVFMVEHKKRQGFACAGGVCTLPAADETSAAAPVETAAKQTQPLPKLLDLGAGKCVPCKMMKPTLDELKVEYASALKPFLLMCGKIRARAHSTASA